jgi:ATPase family associated with various cellular activities (AAA)
MALPKLDTAQLTPPGKAINEALATPEERGLGEEGAEDKHLLEALRWLDRLLERAIAQAQIVYGAQSAADPYRGLYIGQEEVERLLACEPGAATLPVSGESGEEAAELDSPQYFRLAWLAEAFGLSRFDLQVVLIALAPELDLRYERLYGYLQDNVTRRRPTVDLILNLLCSSAQAKIARRVHFATDAPLIRQRLVHLVADPPHPRPPLLAHCLKLDEQVISLLLGENGLDARLEPFCQLITPNPVVTSSPLTPEINQGLLSLICEAREARRPVRLFFEGPRGVGKRRAAEALAGAAGARLLVADLRRAFDAEMGFAELMNLLWREAWFQDALLFLDEPSALRSDERAARLEQMLELLADESGVMILADAEAWTPTGRRPTGITVIRFPTPDYQERQRLWATHLAREGLAAAPAELDALAGRFHLTENRIADAVATACNLVRMRNSQSLIEPEAGEAQLPVKELFAAARGQSGHGLAALARKIEPVSQWRDLVLPADSLAQLREICQRVNHRQSVLEGWGFGRKFSAGKGVNALFAGPSGTGKTMAAEIIGGDLGLDLYKIDLAGVISKYIGETEKNLDRIFRAAQDANAILFFDEADALFGKRSEVRDSHDRYANIEISYLLQKMEEYEGVAILATNLRQHMDESFVRRLAFTIHFPSPDESSRRLIWAGIWPAETPLASDVNLELLAQQFKLSGGNIKNIALAAAFLAAEDGSQVTMAHLRQATRREYQKMGKTLTETELNGIA